MFRTMICKLFVSMGALLLATTPMWAEPLPYGTYLGEYKGVKAYSNHGYDPKSSASSYIDGKYMGTKYSCEEYVNRFYFTVYKKYIAGGTAKTYFQDAKEKGLKAYANGGTYKPQAGDILVSEYGQGYVAIICEVGDDYIKFIGQNSTNAKDATTKLTLKVDAGTYTILSSESYRVQGYLRLAE